MNIFIFLILAFVVIYIAVCAFKYAHRLLSTMAIVITGSTLAYPYCGQAGVLTIFVVSPVLYVAVSDFVETLKSAKPFVLVETRAFEQQHQATDITENAPLTGEWISGKTPKLAYRPVLIGDVKELPRPWI